MNDAGSRKFGIAAIVASGAVAADKFEYALGALAIFTLANVVLKLNGRDAEPGE